MASTQAVRWGSQLGAVIPPLGLATLRLSHTAGATGISNYFDEALEIGLGLVIVVSLSALFLDIRMSHTRQHGDGGTSYSFRDNPIRALAPLLVTAGIIILCGTLVLEGLGDQTTVVSMAGSITAEATPVETSDWVVAGTTAPGPWVEVRRWSDHQARITEPFRVTGPWRIRWRVDSADKHFFLSMMVMPEDNTPLPMQYLEGKGGETSGVFESQVSGIFSLMFHNAVPYEIVVEQQAGQQP